MLGDMKYRFISDLFTHTSQTQIKAPGTVSLRLFTRISKSQYSFIIRNRKQWLRNNNIYTWHRERRAACDCTSWRLPQYIFPGGAALFTTTNLRGKYLRSQLTMNA